MALRKDKSDSNKEEVVPEAVVEEVSQEVAEVKEALPKTEKEEAKAEAPKKKKTSSKLLKSKKNGVYMNVRKYTLICAETGKIFRPNSPEVISVTSKWIDTQLNAGLLVERK